MARIDARSGLRKTFGTVVAVDDVSLTLEDGTFTVLLGPSGCGKTTTLNMIAGLEEATPGASSSTARRCRTCRRTGATSRWSSSPTRSTRTGRCATTSPSRSGCSASTGARSRPRVEAAAAKLGIAELLDRQPRQLSGGQQQRVALARAIVRRPRASCSTSR